MPPGKAGYRPGEPARTEGKWEVIGPPECPLMFRRTLLSGRLGKLLVHLFMPGASDRDPHDHPRPFLTIILRGGYDDVTPCARCAGRGRIGSSDSFVAPSLALGYDPRAACPSCSGSGQAVERLRAPAIRYRPAEHAHITRVHRDGALTVVVMGRLARAWGFIREGRWFEWRDYERRFGLSWRCEDEL